MKYPWLFIASLAAMAASAQANAGIIISTYTGRNVGTWNTAGNWSPSGIPTNGADTYNVLIDNGNAANRIVTLSSNRTISGLTVSSGDALSIADSVILVLTSDGTGPFVNDGVIQLGSTGGNTYLRPSTGPVTFTGTGSLVMSDSAANFIYKNNAAGSIVNGAGHTVRGAGRLGWSGSPTAVTNHGTVLAEGAANPLIVDGSGGAVNDGLMQAATGTLRLDNGTLDNTDGTIEALAGRMVEVQGIAIAGGEFVTTGSGVVRLTGTTTIDGSAQVVINNASLDIANTRILQVKGEVQNNATITVNSTGGNTYLRPEGGAATFSGAGEIVLSDSPNNWIYKQNAAGSLVNGPSHTIRGSGNVGWSGSPTAITNNGTIKAEGIVNPLIVDGSGGFVNNNLLQASTGTLRLSNGTIDNIAGNGVVEALTGEIVELSNVTIAGGELTSSGTGYIRNIGTGTLDGSAETVINDATIDITNNTVLNVKSALHNDGTITIGGPGNTYLRPTGPTTFSGTGEVVLSDSTLAWIYKNDATGALTNGSGHTIRGAGNVGWTGSPTQITNNGTILADAAVNFMRLDCSHASGTLNTGLIHVTGAGGMTVSGSNFTNQGAVTIDAARSLTRSGGTYSQTAGTTTVNGTLTLSATSLQLAGGTLKGTGTVVGPITNSGGTVEPGNSVGTLNQTGAYTQNSLGRLRIEIGGTGAGQYDRLAVSGAANLGGALELVFVNGYVPTVGHSFTILTAGSRTGTFTALNQGTGYCIQYTPTAVTVTITATCIADIVCSGTVNTDDLLAVISSWGACPFGCAVRCIADSNNDCVINTDDLLSVIGHWGACP